MSEATANGSVFLVERKRGPVWYAKYRVYDPTRGRRPRQIQKRLGPAWTPRSAPPAGYLTRKMANAKLDAILTDARRNAEQHLKSGMTFENAAEEWLRHGRVERQLKPSTLRDYRSVVDRHLIPAFGPKPLEAITPRVLEEWLAAYIQSTGHIRQARKLLAVTYGIYERARRVWGVSTNPAIDVEKPTPPLRPDGVRLLLTRGDLGAGPRRPE